MIKAIALDAFGTLVHIADRRGNPMKKLLKRIKTDRGIDLSGYVMRYGTPSMEKLGRDYKIDSEFVTEIANDLAAEVSSVTLFTESISVIERLRHRYSIHVASNLASPYGEPLRKLLQDHVDGFAMSYDVGSVKPEKIFYDALLGMIKTVAVTDIASKEIMMIGDSYRNDHDGAIQNGMQAMWLNRQVDDLDELTRDL